MKQVTIRIDESTHKAAKIKAVTLDKSFMQYVVELIEQDLQKEKE